HGFHALLERHCMPTHRHMARKSFVPFLYLLSFRHLFALPEQPDPEPALADDM
ncbi:MAG: hypothetical protein L6R35_001228, partial [Caloplaca aegaea]